MGIHEKYFDLGYIDTLSYKDTPIHSLDPRAKLIVTLFFMLIVVSFSKYELTALVPLFLFPIVLMSLADLPIGLIAKKILIISPFAILLGAFNPLFDCGLTSFGAFQVKGGWVSFLSLLLRFLLTVSAALILVATTSFPGICSALDKLKVPKVMVLQLLFLYRFIFVLMEEAYRMVQAKEARDFSGRGTDIRTYTRLLGVLFLRTVDRAQRIQMAMFSRGPNSHFFYAGRDLHIGFQDLIFISIWPAYFVLCRWFNLSEVIGSVFLKTVR